MANIKFKIEGEFSEENVQAFAMDRGWKITIPDPANVGQSIPNTQTATEFVENYFSQLCMRPIADMVKRIQLAPTKANYTAAVSATITAVEQDILDSITVSSIII